MRTQDPLRFAHPSVRRWFEGCFDAPTGAQAKGWGPIAAGASTLLLAPTGSGKTLAAFLVALDRLMFSAEPEPEQRCRVLYISPLKALGVDIERNLRAPLAGIRAVAQRDEVEFRMPVIGVRSGDTPASERARLVRKPPDILITTPESLFLMLTSRARETLAHVDTVIVDEIHAMATTKRGAHLFTSLERLERLRSGRPPLQRIGLSATQRPLEEIARLLGGFGPTTDDRRTPRTVEIVDAGSKRPLELRVEVPVEDMTELAETSEGPETSIWPAIHPRLVALIDEHRSTMIFCNSRRLAERLAQAINETASRELAMAHHGSIAKEKRAEIEDGLKRGTLPAIVATSSLELGIDMGAVDLVIQIEAPPSIASGLQRVGRARHQVGGTPRGVLFPKYRGDLLACAAVTERMRRGEVESSAYPRNPLDVLAQQVVAMVAMDDWEVDELYQTLCRAAPFAELSRRNFEAVLDMLSGRYPSDEFAALRPRLTWDRSAGRLEARRGAQRIAVVNGGTIPDRGLYGVFLPDGDGRKGSRVGELDEEMVFESQAGDVFLLGASSWQIQEITHDRVIVLPAPGQPGRMPFWHGDRQGRPLEFGRAIGALARRLGDTPRDEAIERLRSEHGLEAQAAENLLVYLHEQKEATGTLPGDRCIVVERFTDEVGDWRICVLSPFGGRVHAPWATAVVARMREATGFDIDSMWSDDGMVFRVPEADRPPDTTLLFPEADEIEDEVVRSLADTALFASHFRENAGRALLLPKRAPGKRVPLWVQRRRSTDLLRVASRYGDFPVVLETYRECLRDVFDLPGLIDLLRDIAARRIEVRVVDSRRASPFSSSLLFSYVANFLYEGDAPLAERRAQALALDQSQLRELLGDAELRDLLDAEAIAELELDWQRLREARGVRDLDELHDLLLSLGDLRRDEILLRTRPEHRGEVATWLEKALDQRRLIEVGVGGETRVAAAEDAARLRDALGVVTPIGLPEAFLAEVDEPLVDLISRYARTRGPFRIEDAAKRFGLGVAPVRRALQTLASRDRVVEGEFSPGGREREWCDSASLRAIKRRSLARLRQQVEAVEPVAFGRFLPRWHAAHTPGHGLEALLSSVELLQGCALLASTIDSDLMPARMKDYQTRDLDELCAAGEVLWRGLEAVGERDGRIALYLTDEYRRLAPAVEPTPGESAQKVREALAQRGALFFTELSERTGLFVGDLVKVLWAMVWAGEVSNDTLAPLRSLVRGDRPREGGRTAGRSSRRGSRAFRSRRKAPPGTEGRWSLLPSLSISEGSDAPEMPSLTQRKTALVQQLLRRHGIVTRETVRAEKIEGGFSAVYPILKAMEEVGRVRRGYFVAEQGAAQFALPGADDRLREPADATGDAVVLAASDPANPYGAALPWPRREGVTLQRVAGAKVVLVRGALAAFVSRGELNLWMFPPDDGDEVALQASVRGVVEALGRLVADGRCRQLHLQNIDGVEAADSPYAEAFVAGGFTRAGGALRRRRSLEELA